MNENFQRRQSLTLQLSEISSAISSASTQYLERPSIVLRRNFANDFRVALKQSLIINISYLLLSNFKIMLSVIVLFSVNPKLKGGSDIYQWITYMLIHDLIFVFLSFILILKIVSNQTRVNAYQEIEMIQQSDSYDGHTPLLNGFSLNQQVKTKNLILEQSFSLQNIFYLILLLVGNNFILTFEQNVIDENQQLWNLLILYMIQGYFYLFVPLVIICIIIFCLPILFVVYIYLRNKNNQKPANKTFIQNLSTQIYDQNNLNSIDTQENECPICMIEYQDQISKIIILPCNTRHHFHAECIQKWLNINGVCPICRKDFRVQSNDNQV